jgi:hypothetical protein
MAVCCACWKPWLLSPPKASPKPLPRASVRSPAPNLALDPKADSPPLAMSEALADMSPLAPCSKISFLT